MTHQATVLIGSRSAATRLNISVPTLTRWVKAGRIKAVPREDAGPRTPLLFDSGEVDRVARALKELQPHE